MTNVANTEDTSTWLPLDGLAPGFDANRAPHSRALEGREITVALGGQGRVVHEFGADTVSWEDSAGERGTDVCEVFEVDSGLYYAQFQHSGGRRRADSLVLDLTGGRALRVRSEIGDPAQRPTAVTQSFEPGTIDGIEAIAPLPAPSSDLVGRRMLWSYSEAHHYEHVYINEQWYSFHCLSGPERGLADTDACTYYKVRPGIYVFAWREKVIPCAAVTVADHRDFRSHGALFGLDGDGEQTVHFTFGAYGKLLSNTVYPPLT